MSFSRRSFLLTAGAAAFATPLDALRSRLEAGYRAPAELGYGPLRPVNDATTGLPLLELPEGFRYLTFGWTGDPMDDGRRIPPLHDGMAAFAGENGRVVLVRNHEIGPGAALSAPTYDAQAGGGTTTTVFDPVAERVVSTRVSLAGTIRNCAGGPTPWGSWLTCEESVVGPGGSREPASASARLRLRGPARRRVRRQANQGDGLLRPRGRRRRSADGHRLRDAGSARRQGCTATFRRRAGGLADGGRCRCWRSTAAAASTRAAASAPGAAYDIHWVDIAEPDRPHLSATAGYGLGVLAAGCRSRRRHLLAPRGSDLRRRAPLRHGHRRRRREDGAGVGNRSAARSTAAGVRVARRSGAQHAGQPRAQPARRARRSARTARPRRACTA